MAASAVVAAGSTADATLGQARHHPRSPFCRPDAARRHRLAGVALPSRPRAARLRGLVYRGWRGQPLRPAHRQRRRWSAATTSPICGARWRATGSAIAGPIGTRSTMSGTGSARERVRRLYAEADGLINLCGATRLREEHLACPVRIMVDTDPVYEQIKYAKADPRGARLSRRAHPFFQLWRESRRAADCPVPLSGVAWRPTRPPVVPACGPSRTARRHCFTTIATWENKGKDIEFAGSPLCLVEAREFPALPRSAAAPAGDLLHDGDAAARRRRCATQVDRRPAGASSIRGRFRPAWRAYRDFIAGSRGEFTVAKDIYVRPNSGWFSDRSVCYLAAGPAGGDDAHRVQQVLPGRARPVRVFERGRGARRDRRGRRRLPGPQPRGAGAGRANISPPTGFSAR